MKIYTKTGDTGDTGLIGGMRVSKTSPRIAAIGEINELNASIGFARRESANMAFAKDLEIVQNLLFEAGAEIASPGEPRFETLSTEAALHLEGSIDAMNLDLTELRNFILPGGSELAARLHLSRSICRRAERTVLELHSVESVRGELRVFLNRLADWLFVAARRANLESNIEDVSWKRGS